MISFKELLSQRPYNHQLQDPTVSVSCTSGHTLYLKLDKKEVVTGASYTGPFDPWLSALCNMANGSSISSLHDFSPAVMEAQFRNDQTFWDHWSEKGDLLWFLPLEMFRSAVDKFEGKEHLYLESSPLVCRCFGVREDDILKGHKGKAGMGCRGCLPQIEELQKRKEKGEGKKRRRYYKQLSHADWLILTDEKLNNFSEKVDWGMEVGNFKGQCIVITYNKHVTQKEEEQMALEIQDFLGALVDSDLSFLLRRS